MTLNYMQDWKHLIKYVRSVDIIKEITIIYKLHILHLHSPQIFTWNYSIIERLLDQSLEARIILIAVLNSSFSHFQEYNIL